MPAHTFRLLTTDDLARLVVRLNPVLERAGRSSDALGVARVIAGTINHELRTGLGQPNPIQLGMLAEAYLQSPGQPLVPRTLGGQLYECAEFAAAIAAAP